MTGNLLLPILAFILSAAFGFVFIPQIMNFCMKKKLYDIPNERKVHKNAVPRLGGVSFLPCMVIATLIALIALSYSYGGHKVMINTWALSFAIGLLMIYAVGLVDDLIGLSAWPKFIVQIIAASLIPFSNLYINDFYGFCGITYLPFYIGAPLTVFILVFIMNSMNLIDGIDGLSGSLSLIALIGFFYCFYREGLTVYCILIAGMAGVIASFLYFNIWGDPKKNRKIFMGDSGSLTIGYILGILLVKFSMNNPQVMPYRRDSMLIAVTLLIVPTFDVARVIIVRMFHHKPIFQADKNHIHHKLMRTGMTQHQALCTILLIAIFFIALNVILFKLTFATVIIFVDILLYILLQYAIDYFIRRNGKEPYSKV